MKLTYFPGCSALESSKEYDLSIRAVCEALDVELEEIPDWNCCGADVTFSLDRDLGIEVAARNMALAKGLGRDLIVVGCSGCYQSFSRTVMMLDEDAALRRKTIERLKAVGVPFDGKVKIKHLLDIIVNDIGLEEISKKVAMPLKGLKVAPYYGCAVIRPEFPNSFDDIENPQSLENLINTLGAKPIYYPDKVRCCGGALTLRREEFALKASHQLLSNAKKAGAQCMVTPCPLCHLNLDLMQPRIESKFDIKIDIPILYFTQLMGLAFGIAPKKLGLTSDKIRWLESVLSKSKRQRLGLTARA
jgi:heterodisulfide reductase subunit B